MFQVVSLSPACLRAGPIHPRAPRVADLRNHRNVNSVQVGLKARIIKAPLGSHEWRAQFLQIPRGCRKVIHD